MPKKDTTNLEKKGTMVKRSIENRLSDTDLEILVTADYIANRYKEPLLGVQHMADLLGVSVLTVRKYIQTHKLPFKVTRIGSEYFTTPFSVAKHVVSNQEDRSEFFVGSKIA